MTMLATIFLTIAYVLFDIAMAIAIVFIICKLVAKMKARKAEKKANSTPVGNDSDTDTDDETDTGKKTGEGTPETSEEVKPCDPCPEKGAKAAAEAADAEAKKAAADAEAAKAEVAKLREQYQNLVKVLGPTIAANKAESELEVNGAKLQRAKLQLAELVANIEALISDTDEKLVGKEDEKLELKQLVDEVRTLISGERYGEVRVDTVPARLSGDEAAVAKAGEALDASYANIDNADVELQESTDKLNKANSASAELDAKKAAHAEKKQMATDSAAELKKPLADAEADVKATEAHAACYDAI